MMIRLLAPLCVLPLSALADVPRVMTDIAPIHSIVAQVMGDLGGPDVLLPPGADPHDFAMRPSDAARLGEADLVIWVGSGLTPWLGEPLETLAPNAKHVSLLNTSGWDVLDVREEVGGHDEHEAHGEDKAHEEHDDHETHDAHDDHAGHDHGDTDPHAWLDPVVAGVWATAIAAELSELDPENAATYAANAQATIARLTDLQSNVAATLQGLETRAYVLPHDGYQYFETRFGLTAQAAIAGIDARSPGPAQVTALRDEMAENNVVCVFSDAAIGDSWANLIIEGTDAQTAQIDGVGVGLEAGPDLYDALVTRLADNFATCLGSDT